MDYTYAHNEHQVLHVYSILNTCLLPNKMKTNSQPESYIQVVLLLILLYKITLRVRIVYHMYNTYFA